MGNGHISSTAKTCLQLATATARTGNNRQRHGTASYNESSLAGGYGMGVDVFKKKHELIDLIGTISLSDEGIRSKDFLGRV